MTSPEHLPGSHGNYGLDLVRPLPYIFGNPSRVIVDLLEPMPKRKELPKYYSCQAGTGNVVGITMESCWLALASIL
jgi:hypothetical protein